MKKKKKIGVFRQKVSGAKVKRFPLFKTGPLLDLINIRIAICLNS